MARSYALLKKRSEFKRTYESGRSWANHLLVLYLARTSNEGKFGFSVGRRVGCAVVRNLVRRRLKEACHGLMGTATAPGNCIIIARANSARASYIDLSRALSDLLKRAKVLC